MVLSPFWNWLYNLEYHCTDAASQWFLIGKWKTHPRKHYEDPTQLNILILLRSDKNKVTT